MATSQCMLAPGGLLCLLCVDTAPLLSWLFLPSITLVAGFGLPNRRKRVFILASLHGDARDVLLTQGVQVRAVHAAQHVCQAGIVLCDLARRA